MLRLTASAIARFDLCPRQLLLADIERRLLLNQASPMLVQAQAIHHALERFFGLPLEGRRPANLVRELRAVWPLHRRRGAFGSRDEEAYYGRTAVEMLERFAEMFSLDAVPLIRGRWLRARTSSQIELSAMLDPIDARGGELSVIDYKTGWNILELEDLAAEPAVWMQSILAAHRLGRPVSQIRLIFLRAGAETTKDIEREDREALQRRLSRKMAEIRATETFEARPGVHCGYCRVSYLCEARRTQSSRPNGPEKASSS